MRSISLNKATMEELSQIMSKGNTLLKECADMMGLEYGEFRGLLFHNKLNLSKLTPEQVAKVNSAKPHILEVREKCERKILEGFNRMVMRQAKAAARHNYDVEDAYLEFRSEGQFALLDAVYGYTNLSIKFSNYVWQCIHRRIVGCINRMNPFCPLTNEALELLRCYNTMKAGFNRPVTEEEVIEAMGLTPKERDILVSSMLKVVNETIDKKAVNIEDYTSNRRGVDRDFKQVFVLRKDVRQAVKNADLDGFELECVMAELYPYHGWKEDVASKYMNEKTGKRFTRQTVQFTLERAMKKVQEAYLYPPDVNRENPLIDKLFDEMDGKYEK